ncbi:YolD-like family protein [Bacillus taeanensis]|uniref:YolD-like family protein n=1 Tax=Bacillus taeanensis TaxID=273032 RepID=A0A366XSL8_9BACI|nr:YolD-like family protein [Bacillus taeanensis]RBW68548.1 hypothetical protein DS031_16380 [Bacillus taeanensis]
MILKKIIKNGLITINYYKDGVLNNCQGYVHNLDLAEQTISLKDQQNNTLLIHLSKIIEVY